MKSFLKMYKPCSPLYLDLAASLMAVNIYTYDAQNELHTFEGLEALAKVQDAPIVWIDIESEDSEILSFVASRFELHELTVEDCLAPGHAPKLDHYGRYVFMIFRSLRFVEDEATEPAESEDEDEIQHFTRKVAIYLSERFIITFRRREIPWLDAVLRQVRQIPERTIALGTSSIAHRIIDVLIDRFARELSQNEDKIEIFEDLALKQPDNFELSQVLDMKHRLGGIRHIMRDQRTVISRLAHDALIIQDEQRRKYYKDIDDHALQIIDSIEKQFDNLNSVRDVYITMNSVRLGDTMKILAMITTIAVPLNIVVGLYGMNFDVIPLLHHPAGFWGVVGFLLCITLGMIIYFRKKRWI